MLVRRLVHKMGYRYGVHSQKLPGKPDLVFGLAPTGAGPNQTWIIGGPKLARNRKRDAEHIAALETAGWSVLVVWECETRDPATLRMLPQLQTPGHAGF
jgi:DNA mismatch endonuclease, patch repair protein